MADIARQKELRSRIARTLIDSAGSDAWTRMTMFWSAVGGNSHAWLDVTDSAGAVSSRPFPREVAGALSDLKAAMANPAKGTWVSALVHMRPDGRLRFDFDHDRRVSWRVRGRELDGPGEDEEPYPDDALWMTEFERS